VDLTVKLLDVMDALDEAVEKLDELMDDISESDVVDEDRDLSVLSARLKNRNLHPLKGDSGDVQYLKDLFDYCVQELEKVKSRLDVLYLDDI
jgi:hypothetical protein